MNSILQMAAFFLAQLSFGSAILMPFLAQRAIGRSFTRFYYGFIVLLQILFLICLFRMDQLNRNHVILTALAGWIWALSFTKEHAKIEDYLQWVYAVIAAALLFIYPQRFLFGSGDTLTQSINHVNALVGSVFLAFGVLNMIFGHWYLVNRALDIRHLIATSKWLIAVTYTRVILSAGAVLFASRTLSPDKFERLWALEGHGVFFWARFLAGFGIPVLVVHLTYASAKIGSNQSATGIMYAGTAFVLMGELLNLYLFLLTGFFF